MKNYQKFQEALEDNYKQLFKTKEFAYVSKKFTPKELAKKATKACSDKTCILGVAIKMTCKQMGIKPNVKILADFLNKA